jgi:hypothetical protein
VSFALRLICFPAPEWTVESVTSAFAWLPIELIVTAPAPAKRTFVLLLEPLLTEPAPAIAQAWIVAPLSAVSVTRPLG